MTQPATIPPDDARQVAHRLAVLPEGAMRAAILRDIVLDRELDRVAACLELANGHQAGELTPWPRPGAQADPPST